MAALEKNGLRNSLRFFVSGSVVLDCRDPVKKGLSCQTRVKGVPTRYILRYVGRSEAAPISSVLRTLLVLLTGYNLLGLRHVVR